MIQSRKHPTFIGIGAPKCATTWISECMRAHPEIFITNPKETHYFSTNYGKGPDWYYSHYHGAELYKVSGEVSTSYFHTKECPERIYQELGMVKCIAVVRDPVDRFLSDLKHAIRNSKINLPANFICGLKEINDVIKDLPTLYERSFYYNPLNRYIERFNSENILIFNQQDFQNHPGKCLKSLFRFLEVDETAHMPRAQHTISKGINPRFMALERMRKWMFGVFRNAPGVIPMIRKSGIPRIYRNLNAGEEISLSSEAREWLASQFSKDWSYTQDLLWRPRLK